MAGMSFSWPTIELSDDHDFVPTQEFHVSNQLFDVGMRVRRGEQTAAFRSQMASKGVAKRVSIDEAGNVIYRAVDRDPRIQVCGMAFQLLVADSSAEIVNRFLLIHVVIPVS